MTTAQHTTSALTPFQFGNHPLSIITHDNGEPWFIAKEVCDILSIKNVSMAVRRLEADEKAIIGADTLGGKQDTLIISESGLYELARGSSKKEAKVFQRWVNRDVLPQIRKTGQYMPEPKQLTASEMFLAQANINVELEQRQLAIEARQDAQDEKIAALQERQPPDGRLNVNQFLRTYSKPYLPREVLDAFRFHCRRMEQAVMFRPDGFEYASPYYTLDTLTRAYDEATRQLSFLAGRRA